MQLLVLRLGNIIARTFCVTILRARFTNLSVVSTLLVPSSSMPTYSFVCLCSANYVGKTTRHWSHRIQEDKRSQLEFMNMI